MLENKYPTVVIANVSEAFCGFLNRDSDLATRAKKIKTEQYRGDRTLIWAGDPKLVITSFPVPSIKYVQKVLGFNGTQNLSPIEPSDSLCNDILRDNKLLEEIINYGRRDKKLSLIPYATTKEFLNLVEVIKQKSDLELFLPETPGCNNLWLLQYLDTKAGFRSIAQDCFSRTRVSIPEGYICFSVNEAASVIEWFIKNERMCMAKSNIGTNGYGNFLFSPDLFSSRSEIVNYLQKTSYLAKEPIVIEEFIQSTKIISPSFEGFVPPYGNGEPFLTYISTQIFKEYGDFCGVIASKSQQNEPWYDPLVEAGLLFASRIQKMGYVGNFDMDAIVDNQGHVYPVEVNPRRTGGTHVNDFAIYTWGANYIERVSLLSYDPVVCGLGMNFDELTIRLGKILYPIDGNLRGIIPTVTSPLDEGEFGCLIVGFSIEDVFSLRREMLSRF